RTPPPREGRTFPTTKKGKTTDRPEQRRHSPQGLTLTAKQGASASCSNRGDHGYRSPTPPRDDNSPPRYSDGSDEEAARCPLSRDIMRVPIPSG
ncbi:hypothetical protein A2U01_0075815, partial [Trifolium medium]|nr:hypothetical protein [Trifolium medium]